MPGALGDVLQAIQSGLSQIPPAAIVVGLLFGPTLAWIGYRMYVAPRSTRAGTEPGDLFWICPECRSANEPNRQRCYLCQTDRAAVEGALRVVDRDLVVEIDEAADDPDEAGDGGTSWVPVGPGRAEPAAAEAHEPESLPPTVVPFERLGRRPGRARAAIPIESDPGREEDDVLAAGHAVETAPRRRRKRSTDQDAAG